jgi:hypothetical protein
MLLVLARFLCVYMCLANGMHYAYILLYINLFMKKFSLIFVTISVFLLSTNGLYLMPNPQITKAETESQIQTHQSNNWSNWQSLQGRLVGSPVVARNADGRLEVFMVSANHYVYHLLQSEPNGNFTAANWQPISGLNILDGTPAVALNPDGRLTVFARGTNNQLYTISQTSPNGGLFGNWQPLRGLNILDGTPAVASNPDGRLTVFARGTNNQLYTISKIIEPSPLTTRATITMRSDDNIKLDDNISDKPELSGIPWLD